MTINASITFDSDKTVINVAELQLQIQVIETTTLPNKKEPEALYLFLKDRQLIQDFPIPTTDFNQLITITSQLDLDSVYLERGIQNFLIETNQSLENSTPHPVPSNIQKTLSETIIAIFLILDKMGVIITPAAIQKKKPIKARHKWSKEISEMTFFIDTRHSTATVMWINRNQMLIKKGAIMLPEAPLNKDGSIGFAAKNGGLLRTENEQSFKSFVTTDDIILKSVNEVGLFLYFGGTNSWLEMKDSNGKTLNEWTIVD